MLVIKKKITESWVNLDDEDESPLKIKIRPLTNLEQLDLADETRENNDGDFQMTARGLGLAARMAITGWANVFDERGKPVPFNPVNLKRVLKELSTENLVEIGRRVIELIEPGEDEKKP